MYAGNGAVKAAETGLLLKSLNPDIYDQVSQREKSAKQKEKEESIAVMQSEENDLVVF